MVFGIPRVIVSDPIIYHDNEKDRNSLRIPSEEDLMPVVDPIEWMNRVCPKIYVWTPTKEEVETFLKYIREHPVSGNDIVTDVEIEGNYYG